MGGARLLTLSDLLALYDGNWLDTSTYLGALVYAGLNRLRAPPGRPFLSVDTAMDAFNGLALVPLFFLALAVFSSHAVQVLEHFNRLVLSGSAVIALFAVLRAT